MERTAAAFIIVACVAHAAEAQPGCMYGISVPERELYRVGVAPAQSTLIGVIAPLPAVVDLAMLTIGADGLAYTVDRGANVLYTIRLNDARVVASVALDRDVQINRRGLAIAPDGTLWGVLNRTELCTIDPDTGVSTFVATITGATRVESLAFAPSGRLFASGDPSRRRSTRLYELSTTTGVVTVIGVLPIDDLDYIAFGSDGFIYGTDSFGGEAPLYRIDADEGTLRELGSTGVPEMNGLAIALPCACRADLDGDGELTIFDFLAFGNLFDQMSPWADFDGDRDFTIFDFLAFQNAFDAGC